MVFANSYSLALHHIRRRIIHFLQCLLSVYNFLLYVVVYLTLEARTCLFFFRSKIFLWCNLEICFLIFMCKNWEQSNHGIDAIFAGTEIIINLWLSCSVADISVLRLWWCTYVAYLWIWMPRCSYQFSVSCSVAIPF